MKQKSPSRLYLLYQCAVKPNASASPAVTLNAFGGTARRKNDLRIKQN